LRLVVARHLRLPCNPLLLPGHSSSGCHARSNQSNPVDRIPQPTPEGTLLPSAARRSIRSLYFFQFVKEPLTQLKE